MLDITKIKLGKLAAKHDPRSLQMAKYTSTLPAPPPSLDWTKGVTEWGMMLNDSLGDCTCAAIGHGAQVVTLNVPIGEVTPPDILILNLYEHACGYVPGNPNTDQGGVILDVLNYVQKNALGRRRRVGGGHHKKFPLLAFTEVNYKDKVQVEQAIQCFAVVDIGLQLPITAQAQVGKVWEVVGNPIADPNSQPGSWGGHSVIVPKYDVDGPTCITWGQLQKMTWGFWNTYVDESYALFYRFWLDQFGGQYSEMLSQLEADLKTITG
jgi:hypothetical protein